MLIQVLRQQPSISGTIRLAAVGGDFYVADQVIGGETSVFLSDLTAAVNWPPGQRFVGEQVEVAREHPQVHLVDAQVGENGQVPAGST